MLELLCEYDIVMLCEIKCNYPFSVPGYRCLRSRVVPGEDTRGGVAVLFRSQLWNEVYGVVVQKDQVWFRLKSSPGCTFGAVYIAPRDSLYFSQESLTMIAEKCSSVDDHVFVFGDLNSRMGDLSVFESNDLEIRYTTNPDNRINANGRSVVSLCKHCGLVPLNHIVCGNLCCEGNFTYRQGTTWISQLDWILCSADALSHVIEFRILSSLVLPSDHAAVTVKLGNFGISPDALVTRSKLLGSNSLENMEPIKRPVPFNRIDKSQFSLKLPSTEEFWQSHMGVSDLCDSITRTLCDAASASVIKCAKSGSARAAKTSEDRWNKILSYDDPKALWNAINWKGTFDTPVDATEAPSDGEFCEHYEQLLNPHGVSEEYFPDEFKYMPILDDDITTWEVESQLKRLKSNKAAGCDCLPPGVLKLLDESWIILLTYVFNLVFAGIYPLAWSLLKVFNIFKKGLRHNPENYRGISIMPALAKLYDMILADRFVKWYKPLPEQAGSQSGRGCEEQILTLRLIIDIARKSGYILYVTFVDYVKAYDKVDRLKLLQHLDAKGCGSRFLGALQAATRLSTGVIGSSTFTATSGVKQGGCSSCPLFTCFIDTTIEAIASTGPDGWLGSLHCLLLMDDTVVFATSRHKMEEKLRSLKSCVDRIGMVIHPRKSQFLSVNTDDTAAVILDEVTIAHTKEYTYLGTEISNNTCAKQLKAHVKAKEGHVFKFTSFLLKNSDAPYHVKHTVWQSAVTSAILYSCESWITTDTRAVEKPYMSTLKQLLGVKQSTCNDLTLVESGEGHVKDVIRDRQLKFLRKLLARSDFQGSYIETVFNMAIAKRTPMGVQLAVLLDMVDTRGPTFAEKGREVSQTRIRSSTSTRRNVYCDINRSLTVNPMYTRACVVPEPARIATTQLRLSSHRLRIETGRWSRVPREDRLCDCGRIQTEEHILLFCPLTLPVRDMYPFILNCNSIGEIFECDENVRNTCVYCERALKTYM